MKKLAEHIAKMFEFLIDLQIIEFFEYVLVEFIPWIITSIFDFIIFFLLALVVMPAMWVMAYLYPIWETWIKEHDEMWVHVHRVILIIPLSVIVLIGMMIYNLLHKSFEAKIKDKYGLKPF